MTEFKNEDTGEWVEYDVCDKEGITIESLKYLGKGYKINVDGKPYQLNGDTMYFYKNN